MKIAITTDEEYPVYCVEAPTKRTQSENGYIVVEVTRQQAAFVKRYERTHEEFKKLMKSLLQEASPCSHS